MDNARVLAQVLMTVIFFSFFILILLFIFKRGSKHHYSDAQKHIFLDDDVPHTEETTTQGDGAKE